MDDMVSMVKSEAFSDEGRSLLCLFGKLGLANSRISRLIRAPEISVNRLDFLNLFVGISNIVCGGFSDSSPVCFVCSSLLYIYQLSAFFNSVTFLYFILTLSEQKAERPNLIAHSWLLNVIPLNSNS